MPRHAHTPQRHAHMPQRHTTPPGQAQHARHVTSRHVRLHYVSSRHAALRHVPHVTSRAHATSPTPRHVTAVTQGSARASQDAERGEDMGERLDCGLRRKAGFGLASLNNCGGPWNVGGCR